MVRQTISDITPTKRTIRDIPVPTRRPQRPKAPEQDADIATPPPLRQTVSEESQREIPLPPPPPLPPSHNGMRQSGGFSFSRIRYIIVGLLVLGLLALLGSYMFRVQAVVSVVPKVKPATLDGTFMAKKEAKAGELAFQIVTASKEDAKVVPATGQKQVETRSSGTIVIYNNHTTASQRLVKNTRFETADGRIYRIDQSLTVPGKNKDGTPGFIEAVVYADVAGADYNIGLSDFTIPGFKGDARYTNFYARSKTSMTGGFVGKISTASAAEIKSATEALKDDLRGQLTTAIASQIAGGFVLFNNAVYADFENLSPTDSNDIKIKATAYAVVFEEKALSAEIAKATIADYDGAEIRGSNLNSIAFTPIPADVKPWQTGVVSFSLKGTTTLTWVFDQEKLRSDLAGQPKQKDRITEILKAYPGIDHAEVVVRPFWKPTLPQNSKAIEIVLSGTK
jgi:hypothetical protein